MRIIARSCERDSNAAMLSFDPSPHLQKKLRTLQGSLVKISDEAAALGRAEADYLHHCALISNIGASTRIENAVLTDVEVEWVDTTLRTSGKTTPFLERKSFILNKLSKDRERSVEEVVGCHEAMSTVYTNAADLVPLTEVVIRGLHHDLLKYHPASVRYAGMYKTSPNRVVATNHETGENATVLDPAPPGVITSAAMCDLVSWYNETVAQEPWPLLVATEFEFRFLAIHPFQDGNGRLGRALFILILLQADDRHLRVITPYLAIDRHFEQARSQYYAVLHACSHGRYFDDPHQYHLEPLAFFFLSALEHALLDIGIYRQRYARLQQLSESASTVLDCFRSNPQKRLKVSNIVSESSLPRRTIQYALKTLVEREFLQRSGQGAASRYQLVF